LTPAQFWRSVRAACHRADFLEGAEYAQRWSDFYAGRSHKPPILADVGVVFESRLRAMPVRTGDDRAA
jgi:hypothetical protein